jgi:hypothetical protein
MSNGKGSRSRPKTVDNATWDQNWEKIFGKKKKNSSVGVDKSITQDRMKESMRDNQSRD